MCELAGCGIAALNWTVQRSSGRKGTSQPEPAMSIPQTVSEVLRQHVTLEGYSLDRMYLIWRVGVALTWTFSCKSSSAAIRLSFSALPLYSRTVSSERVASSGVGPLHSIELRCLVQRLLLARKTSCVISSRLASQP